MKKQATSNKTKEDSRKSAYAIAKYLRISPRKARLVLDTVRRKPVYQARYILATLNKKAARLAEKVLASAVANARDLGLEENRLYVSDFRADGGPVFKRFMSRSQGRADRILKRTTHLSVIVTEGERKFKSAPEPEAAAAETQSPAAKKPAPKKKRAARKKKTAAK